FANGLVGRACSSASSAESLTRRRKGPGGLTGLQNREARSRGITSGPEASVLVGVPAVAQWPPSPPITSRGEELVCNLVCNSPASHIRWQSPDAAESPTRHSPFRRHQKPSGTPRTISDGPECLTSPLGRRIVPRDRRRPALELNSIPCRRNGPRLGSSSLRHRPSLRVVGLRLPRASGGQPLHPIYR